MDLFRCVIYSLYTPSVHIIYSFIDAIGWLLMLSLTKLENIVPGILIRSRPPACRPTVDRKKCQLAHFPDVVLGIRISFAADVGEVTDVISVTIDGDVLSDDLIYPQHALHVWWSENAERVPQESDTRCDLVLNWYLDSPLRSLAVKGVFKTMR